MHHPMAFDLIACVQVAVVTVVVKMSDKIVTAGEIFTHLVSELGKSHVHYGQSNAEFDLSIELDSLSEIQSDALGLTGVKTIYMHVKLPSMLSDHQYKPAVNFSIGYQNSSSGSETKQFQQHKIYYQLSKICEFFYADHWPYENRFDTLDFLVCLYKHIRDRIPQLGKFCVVCGCQLEHPGLKPVPCNSKACNHAFDELGIGADLSIIHSSPVVADLLISMASAASRCAARRDSLFKYVLSDLKHTSWWSLFYGPVNWHCMHKVFDGLPSVEVMSKQPDLQTFLEGETKGSSIGLIRFRLLRSVLNSCQGHLMQLQEADRFKTMNTEYQFRLCMDSPAKEAVFTPLKKKYGSRFLFHGSAFHNWHSILQEGLKNISGTKMMAHGMCDGSGIYFSNLCTLSAGYCRENISRATFSGFPNSIFGPNPKCLALCEVINNNKRGAIQVMPDPDRVITRYLFVYPGRLGHREIPRVLASSLRSNCKKHADPTTDHLTKLKKAVKRGVKKAVKRQMTRLSQAL